MTDIFHDITNGVGSITDVLGGIFDTAVDYGGKAVKALEQYNVFEDEFRNVRNGNSATLQASAGGFPVEASNDNTPSPGSGGSSAQFQQWGLIVSVIGVAIALFAVMRR